MTTRYDRMRAAADVLMSDAANFRRNGQEIIAPECERAAQQLRADAAEFEAVEREMRSDNPSYTVWAISNGQADDWANRIRGEK